MAPKELHFAVKFAQRFGNSPDSYLNASVALSRLDELLADILELKDRFDKWEPDDNRWAPWVGAEIVSYYWVGFVTCLEWHARSRLTDLLSYAPSAARPDDIKVIKDKVVLEMFEGNVTLPNLVGALTHVSTFDQYTNVFSRVFQQFDHKFDCWSAFKSINPQTGEPWLSPSDIEEMKGIYISRNDLVHEIGITRIGHFNVRDRIGPNEALRLGQIVSKTMLSVEHNITNKLPNDFPNMLDGSARPILQSDRL